MSEILIETRGLTKSFVGQHVLKGIDFSLSENEQLVIQGSSGSGKSTFLYLLGGLDTPDKGEVLFEGEDIARFSDKRLALYRNASVGFVFQFHFLLTSLNCLDNILMPAKIGGRYSTAVKQRVEELGKLLRVDHCFKKYPFEVSGGEQQRINLIRALSLSPKILLCDEPTGNLDSENSAKVVKLLIKLASDFGSGLIVVTHDDNVASQFDNIRHMKDGILSPSS